ncbi:aminoglycoside adenylyltransferase domain-containing protein [Psychrobacillus antarcticus]|uniref:aminoglycoside adenylyltransferase domain-containing protein n=1 Tax=Psychrobacillus antarcticus TaxID=2879115 RepID=UPI002407F877|nr:aminoglycoside adenylyltransferase domain-containing protein [Psychrobacillus antarcticus]
MEIKDFVISLLYKMKEILNEDFVGFYIHGSLAMGGFNSKSSDIDVLVITNKTMTVGTKRKLAELLLRRSNEPFPIEISFMNMEPLNNWTHPGLFDFHFSEIWRGRYQEDLSKNSYHYLNGDVRNDADLAAHITIINHRGLRLEGPPIAEVFPYVPQSHFIASIMGDYQDCLENIEEDTVYCVINLIRVYWYLKEGVISSKQEAANWGLSSLPEEFRFTIIKVMKCKDEKEHYGFEKRELLTLKKFINQNVQVLYNRMADLQSTSISFKKENKICED